MIIDNRKLRVQGFMENVMETKTGPGKLAIFWLGQAGFMIRTPQGKLIAIDPYLSNFCESLIGFKRIMLSVLPPEELETDYLFLSHDHPDHFDADLMELLKYKGNIGIFGPESCRKAVENAGIPSDRFTLLREGQIEKLGEFSVIPVKADHGELAPDAQGFVFDFGFAKVYFAGDTAYSPDKLRKVFEIRPEIALLPINGEYGNLNAAEAVKLSGEIGAKVLIPCHFWTFIEHGALPVELKRAMEQQASAAEILILAQGEGYLYEHGK
jgi:L-ascorbate 6-phosphate lactonase